MRHDRGEGENRRGVEEWRQRHDRGEGENMRGVEEWRELKSLVENDINVR